LSEILPLVILVLFTPGCTAFAGSALPSLRSLKQGGRIASAYHSRKTVPGPRPLHCTAMAGGDDLAAGRREMLGALLCGAAFWASPGSSSAKGEPAITDKVYMDVSIQGVNAASKGSEERESNISKQAAGSGRIVIGLYGEDAPETVAMFKQLFAGTLVTKCQDIVIDAPIAREALQKSKPIKQCKASQTKPINLEDSSVWRIVKDELVSFGRLKGKFQLREAPGNSDTGKLSHDAVGLLTTARGGGTFDFGITSGVKGTAELDSTNIVFGKVLEGLDLVEKLNQTPVKQYAAGLGSESKAKACIYGGKDVFCGVNKPLQRIIIKQAGLL